MSNNNRNDDGGIGCLLMIIMCVVAMPIVGIMLASKEEGGEKALGVALTIVGILVWVKMGMV